MKLSEKEKAYKWGTSEQTTLMPLHSKTVREFWDKLDDDMMVLLRSDAGEASAEYIKRKADVFNIGAHSHFARLHPQVNLEQGGTQIWEHKNGNLYTPMVVANTRHTSVKFPVTVVYQNVHTLDVYSRTYDTWHTSFRRVGDMRMPSRDLTGVGNV